MSKMQEQPLKVRTFVLFLSLGCSVLFAFLSFLFLLVLMCAELLEAVECA